MNSASPSRHFCLTYFERKWGRDAHDVTELIRDGWVGSEVTDMEALTVKAQRERTTLRYAVWQLEESPTTKERHLQMYLEFDKPQRLAAVRALFRGHPIHAESRKGTRDQARDYCRKEASRLAEGGPWEWGTWEAGGQGKRNDIADLLELAKTGASDTAMIESNPAGYARAMKAFDRYKSQMAPPERPDIEVIVLWGEPGTGKSKMAWENAKAWAAEDGQVPYAMTDTQWWDGYDQHKVVVMDDFYGTLQFQQALKVFDRYPTKVEIKGGFKPLHARTFVITSNSHPKDWWQNKTGKDFNALKRRITQLIHFTWHTLEDGTRVPHTEVEAPDVRAAQDWNAAAAVHPGFHPGP